MDLTAREWTLFITLMIAGAVVGFLTAPWVVVHVPT
jgi:hypothetical protein